jgi:organic hydroperoxide reductase OsmC/OhrA
MAGRMHRYEAKLVWTGGKDPSAPFRKHDRSYDLNVDGKPTISGSSDVAFRGSKSRWNPEDLMVAAISACHHCARGSPWRRGRTPRGRSHCIRQRTKSAS